jgi:hypothetical protein
MIFMIFLQLLTIKGKVSRDEYFFESPKNQISTFCMFLYLAAFFVKKIKNKVSAWFYCMKQLPILKYFQ